MIIDNAALARLSVSPVAVMKMMDLADVLRSADSVDKHMAVRSAAEWLLAVGEKDLGLDVLNESMGVLDRMAA